MRTYLESQCSDKHAMCGFCCKGLLYHHVLVGDDLGWVLVAPFILQFFYVCLVVMGFPKVCSDSTEYNLVNNYTFQNSWLVHC